MRIGTPPHTHSKFPSQLPDHSPKPPCIHLKPSFVPLECNPFKPLCSLRQTHTCYDLLREAAALASIEALQHIPWCESKPELASLLPQPGKWSLCRPSNIKDAHRGLRISIPFQSIRKKAASMPFRLVCRSFSVHCKMLPLRREGC